ncbi:MAG: hypothetical protein KBS76_00425 [Ruminococcus sp.]|nr:hypothetical protein [Candidatus Apopatosoma intestinale]
MKKAISFSLCLIILFCLSSCARSETDTLESALLSLKKNDISGFCEYLSEDSRALVLSAADGLNETSRDAFDRLCDVMRYAILDQNEETHSFTVRITWIDFDKLVQRLQTVSAIGTDRAKEGEVEFLFASGKMEALYVKTETVTVHLKSDNGSDPVIPFTAAENKELVDFLNLLTALRYFGK